MKPTRIVVSIVLSICLLAIASAEPASAASSGEATRHVEVGGQGTSCTQHEPCGSIQRAVDVASAGETIWIGFGTYTENVLVETAGLTFDGRSRHRTTIVSEGGRDGAVGNAGNPLDAVFEIAAPEVTITNLTLTHPPGQAAKRDAAVFAWPGSDGLVVHRNVIKRQRDTQIDEPTVPGSRGVFILLSPGSVVSFNEFLGGYQDHVHLPTGGTLVEKNVMTGASRAGVSVMDPDVFADFPSFDNVIQFNLIQDSLDDGIHIQGDSNIVHRNRLIGNGGYGVYLCGDDNDCYPPGANAVSEGNTVDQNWFTGNTLGEVADFGIGNTVTVR